MQTHVHTHTQSQFRIEFLLKMGSVLLQLDHETQQRITTASHRVGMLAQECNTLRGLSRRRVDLRKRLPLHVIKLQALSEVYQQRERARCAEKKRRSAALQTVCDAFSGPGHAYNGADLASLSGALHVLVADLPCAVLVALHSLVADAAFRIELIVRHACVAVCICISACVCSTHVCLCGSPMPCAVI